MNRTTETTIDFAALLPHSWALVGTSETLAMIHLVAMHTAILGGATVAEVLREDMHGLTEYGAPLIRLGTQELRSTGSEAFLTWAAILVTTTYAGCREAALARAICSQGVTGRTANRLAQEIVAGTRKPYPLESLFVEARSQDQELVSA